MVNDTYIIKEGVVEKVEPMNSTGEWFEQIGYDNDKKNINSGGMRIKVKIDSDKNVKSVEDLPWCFPLLPKFFQSVPKVKECVLVLTSAAGNVNSNRFYIGPIISQPQYFMECQYNDGNGPAMSLLQGGSNDEVLMDINQDAKTKGAFPNPEDISIIGRKSEDVTLKEGEIDIRCGVRCEAYGNNNKDIKGMVLFNTNNPSYIQLKFKNSLMKKSGHEGDSVINLVADKINLISHKDTNASSSNKLTDNEHMIPDDKLDEIMDKLHPSVYGDVLVYYLKELRDAIAYHGHNFGTYTMPDNSGMIKIIKGIDFDKILSPHLRIS